MTCKSILESWQASVVSTYQQGSPLVSARDVLGRLGEQIEFGRSVDVVAAGLRR